MKYRFPIFLLICFFQLNSNAQWLWRHPLPQGNALYGVSFANGQTGFAIGDCGTILKTIDNGESWTIVYNDVKSRLYKIYFPSLLTGYAIGRDYPPDATSPNKLILKTNDGGEHWFTIFHNAMTTFNSIWFMSETTGYTVGNTGIIRKTTDAGLTWDNYYTSTGSDLQDIAFFDSLTGISVGNDGDILRTADGGLNWQIIPINLYYTNFKTISLTGPSSAYLCASGTNQESAFVLKTEDAGQTWQVKLDSIPEYDYMECGYFPTQDTGFIFLDPDKLLRTTDGCLSWDTVHLAFRATSMYFENGLTGLATTGDRYGVSIGDGGVYSQIWKTTDGGLTWYLTTHQATITHLYHIEFPSRNTGYAVGGNSQGDIIKTTDGGKSWFRPGPGPWPDRTWTTSFFLDDQVGYIGGDQSAVWKTTNGGLTWIPVRDGGSTLCNSMYFLNSDTGYVTYNNSRDLYITYDGGVHWTSRSSSYIDELSSVCFPSRDTGFVIGEFGEESYILRSESGGLFWTKKVTLKNDRFIKLQFFNAREGIALTYYKLYKTSDAGATWTIDSVHLTYSIFYDMSFIDSDHGYIVGSGGGIIKTNDGGQSWSTMESGTRNALNSVYLFSRDTLIIAGDYSTILSYDNGPNSGMQEVYPCASSLLSKCYPNPANNQITISFDLPNESLVKIMVFDSWGRMVRELISERMSPGKHLRTFDAGSLPAGLYYYSIRANEICETRKVIIID